MQKLPLDKWTGVLGGRAIVARLGDAEHVWSITAEDGQDYILKRLSASRGAPLADEYRVLLHLRDSGCLVAPYVVTDAASLFAEFESQKYVLAPRLAASEIIHEIEPGASPICSNIGRAIGLLDLSLATYPHDIASFEHDLLRQTFDVRFPKLPSIVTERVSAIRGEIVQALNGLPMQRIHGDCNPSNVLLSRAEDGKTGVSGIIDLDHLPRGQKIYDLAYFLHYRAREVVKSGSMQSARSELFIGLLSSYLEGYDSVNPLSDQERGAMIPAMLCAEITSTAWSYLVLTEWRHLEQGGQADGYKFGSLSIRWICEHYSEMCSAVETV